MFPGLEAPELFAIVSSYITTKPWRLSSQITTLIKLISSKQNTTLLKVVSSKQNTTLIKLMSSNLSSLKHNHIIIHFLLTLFKYILNILAFEPTNLKITFLI